MMRGGEYIEHLLSVGRCTFTTDELVDQIDLSRAAANAKIRRLRARDRVATPVRGFHVVVPPQYRTLGCLPPQEFVPFLMGYLDREYYAGLLTAAFFHGAAHQQPQTFQVMVDEARRNVACGNVRIEFHRRADISDIPIETFNTDYGQLSVSGPEVTAIDLVGYAAQIGGVDRVGTILVELGSEIEGGVLREVGPKIAPDAWLQRLGYLLDRTGHEEKSRRLAEFVSEAVAEVTVLVPGKGSRSGQPRDGKWKVAVNHEVETDV